MDALPTERHVTPASLTFFASVIEPFETHSIWFGSDGMPSRRDLTTPVEFAFRCGGHAFSARAGRQQDAAWLEIEGEVGALPYSMQSREARSRAISVLIASKLTEHRYFGVSPDQRIKLRVELALEPPLTPAVILTGVVQFVVAVRPFIELLNEALGAPTEP